MFFIIILSCLLMCVCARVCALLQILFDSPARDKSSSLNCIELSCKRRQIKKKSQQVLQKSYTLTKSGIKQFQHKYQLDCGSN